MILVGNHKFKLETENVSTVRTITLVAAKYFACVASRFQDCEVLLFAENPMWKTGNQLNFGQWVRVGYACEGEFYSD